MTNAADDRSELDFDATAWTHVASRLRLSPRELQIIQAIIDGCVENADVAARLGISRNTVHTYMERLYRKLEVQNRVELVVRVFSSHPALSIRY